MVLHFATVETRDLVQFIAMSVFTVLSVICVLFHIVKSYKAFHEPNSQLVWKWNNVLSYSFLLLFVGFSYVIVNEFLSTYMVTNGGLTYPMCTFWFYFNIISYCIFKLVMFLTLITRLIEAFKQASKFYSCSTKFYVSWKIFLFFSMAGYCYFCLHFAEIDAAEIELGKCRVSLPINVTMSNIAYDFFVCAINLYLFINPLRKLSATFDSSRDISKSEVEKIYQKLMKKNAILASVTILASIGAWIFIALFKDILHIPATWTALDCIITSLCIILLFSWNEKAFHILCCCCIKWKDNANNKQKQREVVLDIIQTQRESAASASNYSNTANTPL